jgi:hypothetical protein
MYDLRCTDPNDMYYQTLAKSTCYFKEDEGGKEAMCKEDTVLLSHEDYMQQQRWIDEQEAKLAVYAHLAQAADDIKLGRVQDADDAFDDISRELEDLVL